MNLRIKRAIDIYKNYVSKQTEIIDDLPKSYSIEPTNYCNLKCPACSTLYIEDKKRYLRIEDFRFIAQQIPKGSYIYFFHFGEPFLNPNIIDLIKEAKKLGHNIGIHSNFNFKPFLIPQIVNSGLDFLSASIDGTTKEVYDKFRFNGNFELAWSNFVELAKLRDKANGSPKELIWQFVVTKYNENDIENARRIASELPNIRFATCPIGLREDVIDFAQYSKEELEELKEYWLPVNKKYIKKSFLTDDAYPIIEDRNCPFLFETMLISVNGTVTPCCYTYKKEHSFGNIYESSLKEIWNNEKYVSSRKLFLDKNFNNSKTICTKCKNYTRNGNPSLLQRNINFLKFLSSKIFK